MKSLLLASAILVSLPAFAGTPVPVLDFCAEREESGGQRYTKKRLVLFQMGGLKRVEAGEKIVNPKTGKVTGKRRVLSKIGGAKHFGEVWAHTFPMRRFHTVMAPMAAPKAFAGRSRLTRGRLNKAFEKGPHSKFLRYSAACADYIAVPTLKAFDARWTSRKHKRKVGKKTVTFTTHSLSVRPTVEVAVFRRVGRAFSLVDRVEETGGGLFDFATDVGALTMTLAEPGSEAAAKLFRSRLDTYLAKAKKIERSISSVNDKVALARAAVEVLGGEGAATETLREAQAEVDRLLAIVAELEAQKETLVALVEDPKGTADRLAKAANPKWADLVSGFPTEKGCFGKGKAFRCGEGQFWLPEREVGVAGLSERAGKACKKVDARKKKAVARCQVRVRAENIALLVRKAAQGIEGWRMFAPLRITADEDADEQPTISLGQEEGVRQGAVFSAIGPDGSRLGFAKVKHSGPGGALGKADPSELVWRSGDAAAGARMEEHPQIGLGLSVQGVYMTAIEKNADEPLVSELGFLAGGSLEVGYDLTPYVGWGWGELWLRTHLDLLVGQSAEVEGYPGIESAQWAMLNALAGPEVKIYLLRRVDLFLVAAGGIAVVRASTPDNKIKREGKDEEEDDNALGLSLGSLLMGGGFDLLITPDWQLRFMAAYVENLEEITLEPHDDIEEGQSIFDGQTLGKLSSVDARVGLTYIF